jgi:hypothetical protein
MTGRRVVAFLTVLAAFLGAAAILPALRMAGRGVDRPAVAPARPERPGSRPAGSTPSPKVSEDVEPVETEPPTPTEPEPDPEVILAEAATLAEEVVARLEAFEGIEGQLADQAFDLKKAQADRDRAEDAPAAVERSVKAMQDGMLLQQRRAYELMVSRAESEAADKKRLAAWSKVLRKYDDAVHNERRYQLDMRDAEAAQTKVAEAKAALASFLEGSQSELQSYHESALRAAEAERDACRAALAREQAKREELLRRRDDAALSPVERRSLLALDEAVRLAGSSQAEEARARLDEATRLWTDERTRRAEARAKAVRAKLGQAAASLRAEQPAPDD